MEVQLFLSCIEGDLASVRYLVEQHGISIESADQSLSTPLMKASSNGHASIVRYLLEKGAEINKCDFKGFSALALAANEKQIEVCVVLIENGAEIMALTNDGEKSPLSISCEEGLLQLVKVLMENGGRQHMNYIYSHGRTILMVATEGAHLPVVEYLLAEGADPNLVNHEGETALEIAVRLQCDEIIHILEDYD